MQVRHLHYICNLMSEALYCAIVDLPSVNNIHVAVAHNCIPMTLHAGLESNTMHHSGWPRTTLTTCNMAEAVLPPFCHIIVSHMHMYAGVQWLPERRFNLVRAYCTDDASGALRACLSFWAALGARHRCFFYFQTLPLKLLWWLPVAPLL